MRLKLFTIFILLFVSSCSFIPPAPVSATATEAEKIEYQEKLADYNETMNTVNLVSKFDPTGTIGIGAGILGVIGTVTASLSRSKAKAKAGEYMGAATSLIDGINQAKDELPESVKVKLFDILKTSQDKHGAVSTVEQIRADLKKPDKKL